MATLSVCYEPHKKYEECGEENHARLLAEPPSKKNVTLRTFISAISWDVIASCHCSVHAKTNAIHG